MPDNYSLGCVALALTGLTALTVHAETSRTDPPDWLLHPALRSFEVTTGTQHLTGPYSSWHHVTLHGVMEQEDHVLQGELSSKNEYDTSGTFLGLTDTITIDNNRFASLSIGVGDGAFYLPRYRLDGFLYNKWLPEKNFVSALGVGYYDAPDGHVDTSISLGGAWYFEQPLVLEGGVRFNRSNPGGVMTHQQFIAASYNPDPRNAWSARVAWGSEGYLPLALGNSLVNFNSQEASLAWRRQINQNWGASISINHYRNPTYERSGVDIGLSRHFD
ncbi:YaiO family outer membrane beta-barrel protein [Actimicrobium sp. CCI2.3]|uniref:YaiO family outer membrane beta-barrel protein n=1 Tax=Actimicrobium sp. CCI2.3 TaxID=3048616 RepID=UPI002AB56E01|nr:YaiO family outer membrane beta-barrel protein [Actimicrobium sp. CCI2.3]MDY7575214.1 YaiO family outer membrane beta-barrel protein [Actimicrobium sp. CCI2.3]MEB0022323.1 YaiO family outer membrane beta-barrel protein [Actimicrobium sp. CCI2.3]